MGKRYVDNESTTTLDAPNNKKRKTDTQQPQFDAAAAATDVDANQLAPDDITYSLTTDVVDGAILTDLCAKKWRCGKPIGKGSFGEIFLASDDIEQPVTSDNAKFVVKIEPHKSGPLFVEIHCLIKAGKATEEKPLPLGMPTYMASGGHYFGQTRYRFLILPRYDFDLHSIIRSRQVETKNILIIANQLIDILEHIHDCGYAHSDIKAENIMIGKCTYKKGKELQTMANTVMATDTSQAPATTGKGSTKQPKPVRSLRMTLVRNDDGAGGTVKRSTTKSKSYAESSSSGGAGGKSSEDSDFGDEDFDKSDDDADDDDDGGNDDKISNSDLGQSADESDTENSSNSSDKEFEPFARRRSAQVQVEFSGSNPMRSCRNKVSNITSTGETYDAMVRSHYLRRSTKKVNYCENDVDEENSRPSADDVDDDDWVRKNRHVKRIYSARKTQLSYRVEDGSGKPAPEHAILASIPELITEDRIHLIDFGLALKFIDANGVHRPFVMDQRRAHDGTLEFTSRDAHMGAHSRRSDLECLAYNLIYWQEGYLPWKTEKIMSQPEQVHRMKEYFMTDIKQFYKKFYNVPIPSYIHKFLTHVANLAYHDRPNYDLCREIFRNEFAELSGISPLSQDNESMALNVAELRAAPQRNLDTDEIDAHNMLKMTDVAKMMKMGMLMGTFCETPATPNQISPKNLRSKAAAATQNGAKKRRAKFSWTEILSTDPDQIARQRAEKEFEREPCDETPFHRYTGKPTYAIIETENLKSRGKDQHEHHSDDYIKGYNKAMMDVWRKRQAALLKEMEHHDSNADEMTKKPTARGKRGKSQTIAAAAADKKLNEATHAASAEDVRIPNASDEADLEKATPLQKSSSSSPTGGKQATKTTRRRKSGLRKVITPTKKISAYRETNRRRKTSAVTHETSATSLAQTVTAENSDASNPCHDEITSSKIAWWDMNSQGTKNSSSASSSTIDVETAESLAKGRRRKYNSSCGMSSPASEEDSHDSFDVDYERRRPANNRRTRGAHTAAKPLVISDEDSRDTTDYSPVKNQRHKRPTKDSAGGGGKNNRSKNNKRTTTAGRGVSGRKVTSELIRTFTRG